MRFTVVSLPSADDELMLIWMQDSDPPAVTQAAEALERYLKYPPAMLTSSGRTRARITSDPLRVEVEISPDDCLVTILSYQRI